MTSIKRIYPNKLPKPTKSNDINIYENKSEYVGVSKFKGKDCIITYQHDNETVAYYTSTQVIVDTDGGFQATRLLRKVFKDAPKCGVTAFTATICDGGDIDDHTTISGKSVMFTDIINLHGISYIQRQTKIEERLMIMFNVFSITKQMLTENPTIADFEGNLLTCGSLFCIPLSSESFMATPLPMDHPENIRPLQTLLYMIGSKAPAIAGVCVYKKSHTLNKVDSPDNLLGTVFFRPIQ